MKTETQFFKHFELPNKLLHTDSQNRENRISFSNATISMSQNHYYNRQVVQIITINDESGFTNRTT